MILDKGFCTVYNVTNIAAHGDMPVDGLVVKYQAWYGELDFETAPIYATDAQEDVEISARIRILQNREISNHDVAVLSNDLTPPVGAIQFDITRAFHGTDSDNGQPITDLTLRKVAVLYDVATIP